MSRITEKRDVQDQLINYLSGIQWTFIGRYESPQRRQNDETQPFLIDLHGQAFDLLAVHQQLSFTIG